MSGGEAPGLCTGRFTIGSRQPEQRANTVQREAKLPRPANEPQSSDVIGIIAAIPALPLRFRQQPDPLVVADRLDVALGLPR